MQKQKFGELWQMKLKDLTNKRGPIIISKKNFWVFIFVLLMFGVTLVPGQPIKDENKLNISLKEWQIRGALAAFDDAIPQVQALALDKLIRLDALDRISKNQYKKIASLLNEKDENVRISAVNTFKNLGELSKDYIAQIAELLEDGNIHVRTAAIDCLGNLGELAKDYFPKIISLLNDQYCFDDAIKALVKLGALPKNIIPHIVRRLDPESIFIQFGTIDALEVLSKPGISSKDYIPQIAALLKAKESGIRSSAAEALGKLGELSKDYILQLVALLKDKEGKNENLMVRSSAVEALSKLGELSKNYVPDIAALLGDKYYYVCSAAARAMGNLGDLSNDYIPQIIALMQFNQLDVCVSAFRTLDKLDMLDKPYILQMAILLNHGKSEVYDAAEKALNNLGGFSEDDIPKIVKLLYHNEPYVRMAAVTALANYKNLPKVFIPKILYLLADNNFFVRSAAAKALGNQSHLCKEYIPFIAKLLDDNKDLKICAVSIEALGRMGKFSKEYVSKIGAFLNHKDDALRYIAIEALGNIGESSNLYIHEIAFLLYDQKVSVRSEAAKALGKIGVSSKTIISQIARLLDDDEIEARCACIEALDHLGELSNAYIPKIAALLDDFESAVRCSAAIFLGNRVELSRDYIPSIAVLLKHYDDKAAGVKALINFCEQSKEFIPQIADFFNDSDEDVCKAASRAFINEGKINFSLIPYVLTPGYENLSLMSNYRFLLHIIGGGNDEVEILLKWIGYPGKNYPGKVVDEEARRALDVFNKVWNSAKRIPVLCSDLEKQIAIVTSKRGVNWKMTDLPLLRTHAKNLESINSTHAVALNKEISSLKLWKWGTMISKILLIHAVFWLVLIFAYPISSKIQAIFFWNPYVRLIMGLGYINFILKWIPYLRQKLFKPFCESLLADARLDEFKRESYLKNSEITLKNSQKVLPITEAIPKIKSQIILEGESGLGKTMFLRHLISNSRRITVYLPAVKCSEGTMKAIQAKLHGVAKDSRFLKNLIYSGAIDICIDGLNEVSAATRVNITKFIESNFKSNIILTLQPIEWSPPSTAKIFIIQPLRSDQIEKFLMSRHHMIIEGSNISFSNYQQECKNFLHKALDETHPQEVLNLNKYILSNPMDLEIVAQMLIHRKNPNLFSLHEQYYQVMSNDYERVNEGRKFPLDKFSEYVYKMRVNDESRLPKELFLDEIRSMERFRMCLSRQSLDVNNNPTKEWYFRHDKIMDFFIIQTFLAKHDKISQHLNDPRFRGVYFQLANLLSIDAAMALREELINYAAETKDYSVSDTFIKLVRSRKPISIT